MIPQFIRDYADIHGWVETILIGIAIVEWVPFLYWAFVMGAASADFR